MAEYPQPHLPILDYLDSFYRRHSQVIILVAVLVAGTLVILLLGRMMAALLVAVILAYLLEGPVSFMEKHGVSRWLALVVVFFFFVMGLFFTTFALVPLMITQTASLIQVLPDYLADGEEFLMTLPDRFPGIVTSDTVAQIVQNIQSFQNEMAQRFFSLVFVIIRHGMSVIIYLVLVPLMVFFLIKDKNKIIGWLSGFMPEERGLVQKVWADTNRQIANFIRGKFWEILIVASVATVAFLYFGLNFAILFGVLTGLSVLIPYIGAITMTIPIAVVAFFQFEGFTPDFFYVLGAYLAIQILDGNVLFPILFSKVVHLHPLAILVALLFFGGIWGFWGLFFAIPLATLVNAVLVSWPRRRREVNA